MKPFEVPLYPYARHADQDAADPVRHPIVIVGAGPVGLALAIDLAQRDVAVVVLDENDKVSRGSRAICFAKRTLEIFDRLGLGDALVAKGVERNLGKVYFDERQVFAFNLSPEAGHKRPAFINLQQYYLEQHLVARVRALTAEGKPISLRGGNRVAGVAPAVDHVAIEITTPDGAYRLEADYLIACDGATSPVRGMLDLEFQGRVSHCRRRDGGRSVPGRAAILVRSAVQSRPIGALAQAAGQCLADRPATWAKY
jgi:3-(3-hydroxy-phenyl)propionate hydroxylase